MNNIRDSLLVVIFAVIICGPAILYVAEHFAKLDLDSRITSVDADYLSASHNEANVRQVLNVDGFTAKELQSAVDIELGNTIPFKATAIIANASMQRKLIELANAPFSYPATPTYFGSKRIVSRETSRMAVLPVTASDETASQLEAAAESWSTLIGDSPQIRWAIFMPDNSDGGAISPYAPGYGLVNNAEDRAFWERHFFSRLPGYCAYIDGSCASQTEWDEAYFKTDHHWQIQGGYAAYSKIARQFGFSPLKASLFETNTRTFWGSHSRVGLCFPGSGDMVWDVSYNASDLAVTINGSSASPTDLDYGFYESTVNLIGESAFTDYYREWFHGGTKLITITNRHARTDKALLIIGDSFAENIERLFAEEYGCVYSINPRIFTSGLRDFIAEHPIDDAVIIMSSGYLRNGAPLD